MPKQKLHDILIIRCQCGEKHYLTDGKCNGLKFNPSENYGEYILLLPRQGSKEALEILHSRVTMFIPEEYRNKVVFISADSSVGWKFEGRTEKEIQAFEDRLNA